MSDTQTNATAPATNGLSARADRARRMLDTGDYDAHPNAERAFTRFASLIDYTPPVGSSRTLTADVMRMERMNHFAKGYREEDHDDEDGERFDGRDYNDQEQFRP